MNISGTLYIISAPSGGGKTSLVNAMLANLSNITVSISHTTRAPRVGEIEAKNYFFVDEATFQQHQAAGIFLEHANKKSKNPGTDVKNVQGVKDAVGLAEVAQDLKCEFKSQPLGIDAARPRLSWILAGSPGQRNQRQSAYRIQVSSVRGALWDTGKVVSSEQNNIAYGGKQLRSGEICNWRVQVWDGKGRSSWSKAAVWESITAVAGFLLLYCRTWRN